MGTPVRRPVAVFRVHPATLGVATFAALLLQTFLPVKIPLARLLDFPLLVTIYFALLRRNPVFGIGLGAAVGLLQDALSHGFIGILGMTKAVAGYLAASASIRFNLEPLVARSVLLAICVLVHNLFLAGLEQCLLQPPPPFQPLDLASSLLLNVAFGLIVFQVLDRFKHPA